MQAAYHISGNDKYCTYTLTTYNRQLKYSITKNNSHSYTSIKM